MLRSLVVASNQRGPCVRSQKKKSKTSLSRSWLASCPSPACTIERTTKKCPCSMLIETEPYRKVPISFCFYDLDRGRLVENGSFPGTALSLLEAQAAVGGILDPTSGEQLSLDEAIERHLVDNEMGALVRRAEQAVTGLSPKGSDEILSLFQAMKRVDLIAIVSFERETLDQSGESVLNAGSGVGVPRNSFTGGPNRDRRHHRSDRQSSIACRDRVRAR